MCNRYQFYQRSQIWTAASGFGNATGFSSSQPCNQVSNLHFPQQWLCPSFPGVEPRLCSLALLGSKAQPCLRDAPDPPHSPEFTSRQLM